MTALLAMGGGGGVFSILILNNSTEIEILVQYSISARYVLCICILWKPFT